MIHPVEFLLVGMKRILIKDTAVHFVAGAGGCKSLWLVGVTSFGKSFFTLRTPPEIYHLANRRQQHRRWRPSRPDHEEGRGCCHCDSDDGQLTPSRSSRHENDAGHSSHCEPSHHGCELLFLLSPSQLTRLRLGQRLSKPDGGSSIPIPSSGSLGPFVVHLLVTPSPPCSHLVLAPPLLFDPDQYLYQKLPTLSLPSFSSLSPLSFFPLLHIFI